MSQACRQLNRIGGGAGGDTGIGVKLKARKLLYLPIYTNGSKCMCQ